MSRTPLPPGQAKVVFNAKMDPKKLHKLRVIAFRKSVITCSKFSQADFIEDNIEKARLPRRPTAAEIARYKEKYPKAEHEEPAPPE